MNSGKCLPQWLAGAVAFLSLLVGMVNAGAPTFDPGPKKVEGSATNGFTAAATNHIKPEWLQPSTEPFRLGPGDRIEIEVLGETGTRASTFVCPDGKIYYDLLSGIDVWGLTLAETKALLESAMAKYYAHPRLVVSLLAVESKRVWIMGRLNKSGVFPLTGPMTVIEAIAKAGGLFTSRFSGTTEELADLNHSFIVRRGEMLPVNMQKLLRVGDTSQNIYLEADDFVYLPSSLSSEIYVLGAVNGPRPVGYVDDMGLVTAIAKALGTQPGAYLSHVAVVRGSLTEPKIAIVDFEAILAGKAPDMRLQAHDIVFVPHSPFQTLERYVKLITDSFVRTVAANEGGRAGRSNFGGVVVTSPVGN